MMPRRVQGLGNIDGMRYYGTCRLARVGQNFNIIIVKLGPCNNDIANISQVNIACAIYCKISLNITMGYSRIECIALPMILKPIYSS